MAECHSASADAGTRAAKRVKRSSYLSGAETGRIPRACVACRDKKVKCSGSQPCQYCSKRSLHCLFPEVEKKKLYSVAYVEDLERIAAMNGGGTPVQADCINADTSKHGYGLAATIGRAEEDRGRQPQMVEDDAISDLGLGLVDTLGGAHDGGEFASECSTVSPIGSKTVLSSSLNFSSHIKTVFHQKSARASISSRPLPNVIGSSDNAWNFHIRRPRGHDHPHELQWPDEQEAQDLLDSIVLSVGEYCHLFEPRSLSDRLALMYEGHDINIDTEDLWTVPRLSARVALSLGIYRETGYSGLIRSEKTHRNRLWWSVYMQDRRLAAATGNPTTIQDDVILVELPTESPGFCSPVSMNLNIRTAKVTGQIMQTIYAQKNQSEQAFTAAVRQILVDLVQISREVDQEALPYHSDSPRMSRSKLSLKLTLYQAMILATRPTLLHLAKARLDKAGNQNIARTKMVDKFTEMCIDGAQRGLVVLRRLQKADLIMKFSFFDIDATFSIALVFVLAEAIFADTDRQPDLHTGVLGAVEIFDYLVANGNKAAENRRADVLQICACLGISTDQTTATLDGEKASSNRPGRTDTAVSFPEVQARFLPVSAGPVLATPTTYEGSGASRMRYRHSDADGERDGDLSSNTWNIDLSAEPFPSQTAPGSMGDMGLNDFFQGENTHDLYSLYCNTGLTLTGVAETDWMELERQITLAESWM
ncbi:Fungal Zn2-Cys6 binuclear cluster domain-containing protein [Cladophialophora immunda]|nr:Fungal Zn2-Cys6 binuclear cluster domain-containing protein [Cladophialophora immunda]